MVMVITLLPVMIIKFLHLLIAVISCVKRFFLSYLKLAVYTTYCPHLAMNPQLKNFAFTHILYRKKARTSRFHSFFIMYACPQKFSIDIFR